MQASRNLKGNIEANKRKPKAQDIAQWFKKKRLASQKKTEGGGVKVLKRKVPDTEDKQENSKPKVLKSKLQRTRLATSDSKPLAESKSWEEVGKAGVKNEKREPSKNSATSQGFLYCSYYNTQSCNVILSFARLTEFGLVVFFIGLPTRSVMEIYACRFVEGCHVV